MASRSFSLLVLCLTVCLPFCQADCKVDEIKVQEDFDMGRMFGNWYETHWIPPYFEKPEEVWTDYVEVWSAGPNAEKTSVKAYGKPQGSEICGNFKKSYRKSEDSAQAKWWTPRYINASYSFPMDTWIISTNYDSYALMWGCVRLAEDGTCDNAASWVWSRSNRLAEDDRRAVEDALPGLCLTLQDYNEMPIGEPCPIHAAGGASLRSISLLAMALSLLSYFL